MTYRNYLGRQTRSSNVLNCVKQSLQKKKLKINTKGIKWVLGKGASPLVRFAHRRVTWEDRE